MKREELSTMLNELHAETVMPKTSMAIGKMAEHIFDLKEDAETSQNHNEGVIDRIVAQLRDAGYSGTLSEMVDAVLDEKEDTFIQQLDCGECEYCGKHEFEEVRTERDTFIRCKNCKARGNYIHASYYFERIAELEKAQRWIPVSERLPEEGQDIFLVKGKKVYRWEFSKALFMSGDYWMPTENLLPPEME